MVLGNVRQNTRLGGSPKPGKRALSHCLGVVSRAIRHGICGERIAFLFSSSLQAGSASFLSIAIVIPIVCIVSMMGLELAGYFATTARNQEAADEAARIGARFGGYTDQGLLAARQFIEQSLPESAFRQVSVIGNTSRLEILIDEPMELPFLNLLIKITGGSATPSVASVAISEVRRLPLQSEVVLELGNAGVSVCTSEASKGAYKLADMLGTSLYHASGVTPYFSVQPGTYSDVDRVIEGLCPSQNVESCSNATWIPEELICGLAAQGERSVTTDGFRNLLRTLLQREVEYSKNDIPPGIQPRIVYRVSYRAVPEPRPDVSLYEFEISEIGQYLRERSGHLDLLDIEVLPEHLAAEGLSNPFELRNDWGTIRRISVSGAVQIEALAGNLAALIRREVIAK